MADEWSFRAMSCPEGRSAEPVPSAPVRAPLGEARSGDIQVPEKRDLVRKGARKRAERNLALATEWFTLEAERYDARRGCSPGAVAEGGDAKVWVEKTRTAQGDEQSAPKGAAE